MIKIVQLIPKSRSFRYEDKFLILEELLEDPKGYHNEFNSDYIVELRPHYAQSDDLESDKYMQHSLNKVVDYLYETMLGEIKNMNDYDKIRVSLFPQKMGKMQKEIKVYFFNPITSSLDIANSLETYQFEPVNPKNQKEILKGIELLIGNN